MMAMVSCVTAGAVAVPHLCLLDAVNYVKQAYQLITGINQLLQHAKSY